VRQILVRVAWAVGVAAMLALALLIFATTHVFDSKDLDPRPYPLQGVTFTPPKSKNGIDYFGKLRLDVYIDADGKVDRVEMLDSTLPLNLRDEAVRAFSQVRWEPGRKWGVRVKSVKRVEVDLAPPPGVEQSPTK
jgi:hypothetical protein